MGSFDFGVNLAFWLMILSTVLCVAYGWLNWNKDGEKQIDGSVANWAKEEDAIEEEL
ncbi:MAG: hypothetical protein IBX44_02410 [Sulfurospirillum sp.]|nr:hypothetical protein [Sulfurospirillum sp.]